MLRARMMHTSSGSRSDRNARVILYICTICCSREIRPQNGFGVNGKIWVGFPAFVTHGDDPRHIYYMAHLHTKSFTRMSQPPNPQCTHITHIALALDGHIIWHLMHLSRIAYIYIKFIATNGPHTVARDRIIPSSSSSFDHVCF